MCARFVPAVVTFVPVFVLIYLLLVHGMPGFYDKAYVMIQEHLSPFWKKAIALMIIYLWGMLVRMFSKWCESKFFDNVAKSGMSLLLVPYCRRSRRQAW